MQGARMAPFLIPIHPSTLVHTSSWLSTRSCSGGKCLSHHSSWYTYRPRRTSPSLGNSCSHLPLTLTSCNRERGGRVYYLVDSSAGCVCVGRGWVKNVNSNFLQISLTSRALAGPRYVPQLLNTQRKHLFQLGSASSRDQGDPGSLLLACCFCGSPTPCTADCTAWACRWSLDPEARCTAMSGRARSTSKEHCWLRSACSSRRTCKCGECDVWRKV